MLQGTLDIRTVALWLDHSNLATTEIYTRSRPIEDRDGIEALRPPHQHKGSFRPPDKLSALLRGQS
jgi:integrase/recombinase XerD